MYTTFSLSSTHTCTVINFYTCNCPHVSIHLAYKHSCNINWMPFGFAMLCMCWDSSNRWLLFLAVFSFSWLFTLHRWSITSTVSRVTCSSFFVRICVSSIIVGCVFCHIWVLRCAFNFFPHYICSSASLLMWTGISKDHSTKLFSSSVFLVWIMKQIYG